MSFKRNLKFSSLLVSIMLIAPILSIAFYFADFKQSALFKSFLITFIGTGILWIPGIFLHLTYYFKDKGKEIKMTNESIDVITQDGARKIAFSDIDEIVTIDNSCIARSPWPDYGFVRLSMKDKSVEKITCLTVDLLTLTLELTRKTNARCEKRCVAIPFLFT